MTMIDWLDKHGACKDAWGWLDTSCAETPAQAVAACPRGEWLLWVARRLGYAEAELAAAMRPARLRAVRVHAPAALDAAGLHEHAARLRALPDDVSGDGAASWAWAAEIAADAASWAWAAENAEDAAARAAAANEWAKAVTTGVAVAKAVAAGEAWDAKSARCAAEVCAALPNLAARWSAAMEAKQ